MAPKKKSKKLNTKENQENIKKDLHKKRMEKRKQNQQRYSYNGGGSRVVQRAKTDVSRAPAYKPEKLSKSSFHSTFPLTGSGNGFFDQRQMLNEILAHKESALNIQKAFTKVAQTVDPALAKQFVEENEDLIKKTEKMKQAKLREKRKKYER